MEAVAINAHNDATLAAVIDGQEAPVEEVTFDTVSRDYRNAKRGVEKAEGKIDEAKAKVVEAEAAFEATKDLLAKKRVALTEFMEGEY